VRIYGYHVPKSVADQFVRERSNKHFKALPYEDRHGVEPATNNYGVWHSWDFYWVFVDVTIEEQT
jgi:hypothetical protein